jgi:hypothetical protein
MELNIHRALSDDPRIGLSDDKIKFLIMDIYSVISSEFIKDSSFQHKARNSDKFFQVMLSENEPGRLDETFNGYVTLLKGGGQKNWPLFRIWLDKVFNTEDCGYKSTYSINWGNLDLKVRTRLHELMEIHFNLLMGINDKDAIKLWRSLDTNLKVATVETLDDPITQLDLLQTMDIDGLEDRVRL